MLGTADDFRREAEAMDRLARVLSFARDKQRLTEKAEEYRSFAASLDENAQANARLFMLNKRDLNRA